MSGEGRAVECPDRRRVTIDVCFSVRYTPNRMLKQLYIQSSRVYFFSSCFKNNDTPEQQNIFYLKLALHFSVFDIYFTSRFAALLSASSVLSSKIATNHLVGCCDSVAGTVTE